MASCNSLAQLYVFLAHSVERHSSNGVSYEEANRPSYYGNFTSNAIRVQYPAMQGHPVVQFVTTRTLNGHILDAEGFDAVAAFCACRALCAMQSRHRDQFASHSRWNRFRSNDSDGDVVQPGFRVSRNNDSGRHDRAVGK